MLMLNSAVTATMSEKIEHFLTQNLGWKIELDEQSFESKMNRITQELGCGAFDFCVQFIENRRSDPAVIQAFAREFSVGESYFFRDLTFFNRLEHRIIPQLMGKEDRSLSVWSVGCSRGEEIYSVAMLLRRMIPDIGSWNLYLLGTDVNPDALEQAEQGVFNKYSFRQIPQTYMRYFKPLGETYELHPEIKKMVHFKYHNIMSGSSQCMPPDGRGFDLILLNNVLIYFEPQKAKAAAERLFSSVEEGGWLATTATEYSMGVFNFPHSRCQRDEYLIQKVFTPRFEASSPVMSILATIDSAESDSEKCEIDLYTGVIATDETEPPLLNEHKKYVHYYDALKMLESGDKEGAKASLRRALYLDNALVMPHVVLGNILKKEGKFEAAMKHIAIAKAVLQQMASNEEVELSDGIRASDLLVMLNAIQGGKFE